jgi:ectoine hydroxylase-related dioxygenase (phytanoyl-CoA dioxygenase family)
LPSEIPFKQAVTERGFAIVPFVITTNESESILSELNHAQLNRSRAGARHILRHPAIERLANDPRLLQLAREVLGDNAIPFRATLFDKSPASNWLVVWHQDTALPLQEKRETPGWGPWSVKEGVTYAHAPSQALEQILAIRVHLDDSTESNGPLRVLASTHTSGVLTDDELQRLGQDMDATECTVNKGGIIAMRPLIVHASSKSQAPQPRRVIHIEYAAVAEFENQLQLASA